MRLTLFIVTLSVLVVWSSEQTQQQQQQEQEKEQLIYHNISILLNTSAIDSNLPLSLQNSVAACCSIIREYFVPATDNFMISTNVQELHLQKYVKDFLNNVLLNLPIIKVEIESMTSKVCHHTFNRKYNLIVVDGTESLRQLDPANLTRNYDTQEHYLVYVMHGARFTDVLQALNEMFTYFWQNTIINVSLLKVNKNSAAEVYTYFPFYNYLTCKMPVAFPLDIAVFDTPPFLILYKNSEDSFEINNFEAVLLNVLSKKLNFSLNLMEPPHNERRGKIFLNGTVTGAVKMLRDHTADLSLGSFRYSLERSELLTAALPYYQSFQIYSILISSQLYTSLELLAYPFDYTTWIFLVLSIQFCFILSFTMHHFYDQSMLMRIAIGFPRLRTPLLNVISIFLGQSCVKIPEANLARFMIISWHIFGLLIRTVYQSLLFQFLKSDLYHAPPKSLAELIEHNCMLVMVDSTFDTVVDVPSIGQSVIDIIKLPTTNDQNSFVYMEFNKNKRCLAAVSPKDSLTYYVIKEKKRGSFYVLPDSIFAQHITMYFSKHSLLIDRFNELFINLRSMGLINFWAHQSLDTGFLDNVHAQVFDPVNIRNLEGILVVYTLMSLMAGMVFVAEIAVHQIKRKFYAI